MADSDKKKKSSSSGGQKNNTKKGSTSSGGKKNSSAAGAARGKGASSSASEKKAGSRLKDEITAVILVALGIFLIVSVMTTATGKFGMILSQVLKGLFGIGAYILPFYIIVYGLLVLMKRMARVNSRSIFFLVLMYVDIVTLNSARFTEVNALHFNMEYVKNAYISGTTLESAGVVGMSAGWLAVKGIGIVGLVILCAAILIISLMLLVNTPISSFLDRRREKKYQQSLEREARREEEEERIREAEEMKAKIREEKARVKGKALSVPKAEELVPVTEENDGFSAEAEQETVRMPASGSGSGGSDAFGRLRIKSMGLFRGKNGANGQEPPMEDNKRQILEYMKDDSLFESGKTTEGEGFGLRDSDSQLPERVPQEQGLFRFTGLDFGENTGGPDGDYQRFVSGAASDEDYSRMGRSGGASAEQPSFSKESAENSGHGNETCETDTARNAGNGGAAQEPAPARKMTKSEASAVIAAGAAEVASQAKQMPEKKQYFLPPLSLLNRIKKPENLNLQIELAAKARKLESVLHDFGVRARVIDVKQGPAVTRYEIQPDSGVKVSSIVNLTNDIALNLEAKSLRIEAPIPGKAAVGIEVENESSAAVSLREMIESKEYQNAESKISFVVGVDIAGNSIVADLKSMPHLLIAGSTGSGKSVCINSIIMSMLYKSTPDEVRFILIDPKVVELGNYNGIPHMLIPVITDPSKAAAALAWAVQEMNDRYRKFAENSVRDLKSYNAKMKKEEHPENVLPQIVIIIDELADLMMAAPSQVEEAICRLAQLARAAGMHLIVATQRPSVDIVTGLIKANIPSRIAFAVSSQFDSRTILDRAGAEKLVGKGDMLFSPIGKAQPERLQGPFVTDDEVNAVIEFWKEQAEESEAPNRIMESINTVKIDIGDDDEEDELLEEAIELVVNAEQASASMLQRRFRIGYNRAGRLVDIMEARGIIGPSEGSKPRRVLLTKEEYYGLQPENEETSGMPSSEQMHSEHTTHTTGEYES